MSTAHQHWNLRLHERPLAIAHLAPGSAVPAWATPGEPLVSVTWNATETSVIAPADVVPQEVRHFGPFLAFEVEGPVGIMLTGVMHGLLTPLAEAHVAVITSSTFETDWILVPQEQVETAINVWRYRGHRVDMLGAGVAGGQPGAGEGA